MKEHGALIGIAPVAIVVRSVLSELDHVRMRTWLPVVTKQYGSPKIDEIRLPV